MNEIILEELKEIHDILKLYKISFTDHDWERLEFLLQYAQKKYTTTILDYEEALHLENNERIEDYITVKYASAMFALHKNTIWKWINKGLIKHTYFGNQIFMDKKDFEKFLESRGS